MARASTQKAPTTSAYPSREAVEQAAQEILRAHIWWLGVGGAGLVLYTLRWADCPGESRREQDFARKPR